MTGKFGFEVENEAGQKLTEFYQENTLIIVNTLFQQHKQPLYTRTSPDGQYWNQIDYIFLAAEALYRLDEAQAGNKISGRNINIIRYPVDTTLMEESKEELKNLLRKVKEESEKVGLKLNVQKPKIIMVSSLITLWQIDGETMETVRDYFLELQSHCRWWLQPWN